MHRNSIWVQVDYSVKFLFIVFRYHTTIDNSDTNPKYLITMISVRHILGTVNEVAYIVIPLKTIVAFTSLILNALLRVRFACRIATYIIGLSLTTHVELYIL